ncbi:hypothetical protein HX773_23230 [Pantoea sp. B9002]|uniref:hypothetical protein n=1 Tax=Pantoea sp. B9002 TaxID=2726979 RepID=UPI0015A40773|nr:hypothetical protein [Pantoea sp. B9002]NWA63822.1 hypothetical protein [Pantoea sp. B9002]
MKKILVFVLIMLVTPELYAGERGYYVFVSGNKEGKEFFKSYRRQTSTNITDERCWNERQGDGIAIAYVDLVPDDLTDKLILDSLSNDSSSQTKVKKIIRTYNDDIIHNGFDAMMYVNKDQDSVELKILPLKGSVKGEGFKHVSYSNFDSHICHLLKSVDGYFSP